MATTTRLRWFCSQPRSIAFGFIRDYHELSAGIKIFIREKMAQGNTRFANDNVVLFLHGATGPSTCDFDLQYKDYSWADWLVRRGYVVYMGDYRNYGGSTREPAMDEPASKNQPVTRSYLALRDVAAMVSASEAMKRGSVDPFLTWRLMES
jgi:alpha-beta hydrolase superfamily lysophospholipase